MLYDAGKLGSPTGAARPISAVLWSRGITRIDALMISHADSDHFNAIPELLQKYTVSKIFVSPFMLEELDQPAVKVLKTAIDKWDVKVDTLSASDKLHVGDVSMEILHPPPLGVIGSDNANSLVLLIEYQGRKVLLPGDLESPGLEDVLAELPIDTDLLMAPHHGSTRSNPRGFGNWCRPEHVVLSGSHDVEEIPAIDSVKQAYGQIGSQVYHTAETGCIRFNITAAGVKVETFRQP